MCWKFFWLKLVVFDGGNDEQLDGWQCYVEVLCQVGIVEFGVMVQGCRLVIVVDEQVMYDVVQLFVELLLWVEFLLLLKFMLLEDG